MRRMVCYRKVQTVIYSLGYTSNEGIFLPSFSINSETFASESVGNLEEIYSVLHYYMHNDVFSNKS